MVGYAHSSEIDFAHGPDISDGGIGVLLFEDDKIKKVLIAVDSNNALTGVREEIMNALRKSNFGFIELCTSDTHNFAARTLTNRGYFALGEATKIDIVVETITKLARLAEERIEACDFTVSDFTKNVRLIGSESLDDFASLTGRAITFTKSYLRRAIPVFVLLLAITLLY